MEHRTYNRFLLKQGHKLREIYEPSEELKDAQGHIAQVLEQAFKPQFSYTYAFQQGKSIVDAVKPHINTDMVITLDIKDFFQSIPDDEIWRACTAYYALDTVAWLDKKPPVEEEIFQIVTHPNLRGVPQGAPSSPMISNIAFMDFDDKIKELAFKDYLSYTRYADDLIFSGEHTKKETQKFVSFI